MEKEVEGMTANLKAVWKYQFGEDYDFYKSIEEVERRNRWLVESIEVQKKLTELLNQAGKLEEKLYGNKDFREVKRLYQEAQLLQGRLDFNNKEFNL